jgi:hypothetical protein
VIQVWKTILSYLLFLMLQPTYRLLFLLQRLLELYLLLLLFLHNRHQRTSDSLWTYLVLLPPLPLLWTGGRL